MARVSEILLIVCLMLAGVLADPTTTSISGEGGSESTFGYRDPSSAQSPIVVIVKNETQQPVQISTVPELKLEWQGESEMVDVNITLNYSDDIQLISVTATLEKTDKAVIQDSSIKLDSLDALLLVNQTQSHHVQFKVEPKEIGRTDLNIAVLYSQTSNRSVVLEQTVNVRVSVIKTKGLMDKIFNIVLALLLAVVTFAMGTSISMETVKETMKRPKAPALALFCQFIIMPVLAYGIIWMEGYTGGTALGFFAFGCAPGGGMSNMYSHLLGGDLSISITLTLLSTVLCVATIPFWLYTLGTTLPMDDEETKIPYTVILQAFALLIVPLAIGLLIQYKLKKFAQLIHKGLSILMVLILIFICVFGVYTNLYIFHMFNIRTLLASFLLPFGGFFIGGALAGICRFDWKVIKTISIETGLQNAGVPYFMIQMALVSPDLELANIPVVYVAALSPIPLLIICLCYSIYNKIKDKKSRCKDVESFTSSCELDSDESAADNNNKMNLGSADDLDKELLTIRSEEHEDTTTELPPPCYEELTKPTEENKLI